MAVPRSTSFRIEDAVRARLAKRAGRDGTSTTTLLQRLITEGLDTLDYPGIVFRGPAHDRRAAVAGGPDVWEVVARLRELSGSEERRVSMLAEEADVHPRLVRLALDYAAEHAQETDERIDRNAALAERSERVAAQRSALLG